MNPNSKITILWHHSWLNGPYTGLAETEDGTKVWFERDQSTVSPLSLVYSEPQDLCNNLSKFNPFNPEKEETHPEEPKQFNLNIDDDRLAKLLSGEGSDDDELMQQVLSEYEDNYKKQRAGYDEQNKIEYYNIYTLTPEQLSFAENYQDDYRKRMGYNKEHDPLLWKPLELTEDDKSSRTFTSGFDPRYMKTLPLGRIHYKQIDRFYQSTVIPSA